MNIAAQFNTAFQDEVPTYIDVESKTSTLRFAPYRLRVQNPRSRWIRELRSKFDELTSLPRGWDGYAARPVSFNCAQFAANLIERLCIEGVRAPQLVPGCDGSVQIEWHQNNFDVEIDVLGPYEINAVRRNVVTGEVDEIELQNDFTPLGDWIIGLRKAEPIEKASGD